MKKIIAICLSIILFSFGYSNNAEASELELKQEKEKTIQDLEFIKNNFDKKNKKEIDAVTKEIKKTLNEKYWKLDSIKNFKDGKKVLDTDKKVIKILDKILHDKKISKEQKQNLNNIILKIIQIDKILVQSNIDNLDKIVMSSKSLKKLDDAKKTLDKGDEYLEKGNYNNSIKNYIKALDQIKHALKTPHMKKMELVELEGTMNFDWHINDLDDVYLKIIEPKKSDKPKKVEIKIAKECVKGDNYEDAAMKVGFSIHKSRTLEYFDEEFEITNKWFKKYDFNKKIDPVVINTLYEYDFEFPESGDDLIQANPSNMKGSFEFISSIPELDGQSGWDGKFEFKGEAGDYFMNFFFPHTVEGSEFTCNFVTVLPIPTTINP